MAACYFLGAKSIKSKKSGKFFYPAKFLSVNAWGEWEIFTKFCASEEVFDSITDDVIVGAPVVCTLDMQGNVLQCVAHDSVPALELPEPDEMGN